MTNSLTRWDIYEISSPKEPLHGVMLRGKIRKLGIEKNFNVLVENSEDADNRVRFAVITTVDAMHVIEYVKSIIDGAEIDLKLSNIVNPVISKLKVNTESRYDL